MSIYFRNQGRFISLLEICSKLEITVLCSFLLYFCFVAIFATRGYAQRGEEYGRIWKSMNTYEHHYYLVGLQEGTNELGIIKAFFTGRLKPYYASEEAILKKLALSGSQRELLTKMFDRHLKEIDIELFGANTIADVMTNIYNDPANNFIDFKSITKIAVMKLKGKSDEDITRELNVLRRAAAKFMSIPKP